MKVTGETNIYKIKLERNCMDSQDVSASSQSFHLGMISMCLLRVCVLEAWSSSCQCRGTGNFAKWG